MGEELNWLGISAETLNEEIMNRWKCNQASAASLTKKIASLDMSLRDDFLNYWNTGEYSCALVMRGYSLERLIKEWSMKPYGAFATLDWLIREPEKADAALKEGYCTLL